MLMLVMKNLCELVIRQKKYSKIKESIRVIRSQRSDMEKRQLIEEWSNKMKNLNQNLAIYKMKFYCTECLKIMTNLPDT